MRPQTFGMRRDFLLYFRAARMSKKTLEIVSVSPLLMAIPSDPKVNGWRSTPNPYCLWLLNFRVEETAGSGCFFLCVTQDPFSFIPPFSPTSNLRAL